MVSRLGATTSRVSQRQLATENETINRDQINDSSEPKKPVRKETFRFRKNDN